MCSVSFPLFLHISSQFITGLVKFLSSSSYPISNYYTHTESGDENGVSFLQLTELTASEGRERYVKGKLLDYSGRDHHENKRCTYWTEVAKYCKMKNENLSSRVAQGIST